MEMVLGLGVLVRDVLDADTDLTKYVEKLRVLQFRVDRLFQQTLFHQSQEIERSMYRSILNRSKVLIREAQEKLKNMGLAGKISINLPFDKTKANLKEAIEELEKANVQLRDRQLGTRTIKRVIKQLNTIDRTEHNADEQKKQKKPSKVQQTKASREINFDPTLVEYPPSPQMLATLQQKNGAGNNWMEICIELRGSQELMKIVEQAAKENKYAQEVEKSYFRIEIDQNMKPQQVFQFNRKYFKAVYEKARKAVVEIDFISSKRNHFDLTLKHTLHQKNEDPGVEEILISATKECLNQKKKEAEAVSNTLNSYCSSQFFSFPERLFDNCLSKSMDPYELDGTYIKRAQSSVWELVEKQIHVLDGDEISPIMKKPQKTHPAFSFKISMERILL